MEETKEVMEMEKEEVAVVATMTTHTEMTGAA